MTAPAEMPRTAPISAVESCSRWRRTRTSRSRGGSSASAARSRWRSSAPNHAPAGTGVVGHQAIRQLRGRLLREHRLTPPFSNHAPPLGTDVPLMTLHQVLPGDVPQPGIERQRALAEVIRQPPRRLGEGLLDDVGRVDPRGHAAIEPDRDHPPQPRPVPGEKLVPGPVVASAGTEQAAPRPAPRKWFLHRPLIRSGLAPVPSRPPGFLYHAAVAHGYERVPTVDPAVGRRLRHRVPAIEAVR